jgi:heavy metal translocating P-type ATPase
MTANSPQPAQCTLCGRPVDGSVDRTGGEQFCSEGCRTVYATIVDDDQTDAAANGTETSRGPQSTGADPQSTESTTTLTDDASEPAEDDSRPADPATGPTDADSRPADTQTPPTGDTDRLFLRVDGMYSATCETYLEAIARGVEGVSDAEASYVTETIRIDYRPGAVTESELCAALSTTGYTAVPREDAPISSRAAAQRGERQLEQFLDYRYAAGVVFGTFLMLIYVSVLYPAYLSSLLGAGFLDVFAGTAEFEGRGRVFVLRLFLGMTGVILFFTGLPLLRGAYVSLKMRQLNTELLVAVPVCSAYLYSGIAIPAGRTQLYFDFTIVVTAIVVAAMFYESLVKQRAAAELTDLTVAQLDEARLYDDDGSTRTVPVEELSAGDRILVTQGERIPVDGELAAGECAVDEAIVTGESLPVVKRAGDDIVGGSVVTADAAVVTVSDSATSGIDRLLETVWGLQSAEHGVQRRANRLARVLVPVVAVAIGLGGARLALGADPVGSLMTTLLVLLVGSPWALGFATPLSVATSLAEALSRGIVIFDETIFERLRDVDTVVFDKTGTLTTGEMHVVEADAPEDLLEQVAALERRGAHPAAEAIATAFGADATSDGMATDGGSGDDPAATDGNTADDAAASDGESPSVEEFTSHASGVEGTVDGTDLLVGTIGLFETRGWSIDDGTRSRAAEARGFGRLPVVVGRDGEAAGLVVLGDEPREQYDEVLSRLAGQGIEVVVLTGDDEEAARFFGDHPHVEHVFAGVPPAGKTAAIRLLQRDRYVTMVGDGTNDAPALARADLGISLGSGTALASDAADVTILDDELRSVEEAFELAHGARRRVLQNNGLALVYNALLIPLSIAGLLNPLLVMGVTVATSGLIGLNSTRNLVA